MSTISAQSALCFKQEQTRSFISKRRLLSLSPLAVIFWVWFPCSSPLYVLMGSEWGGRGGRRLKKALFRPWNPRRKTAREEEEGGEAGRFCNADNFNADNSNAASPSQTEIVMPWSLCYRGQMASDIHGTKSLGSPHGKGMVKTNCATSHDGKRSQCVLGGDPEPALSLR